ncbi:hypothetical protein AXF42_Ash012864 [Apostasia shenzhenica]|uniref:Uncharacterized protein n=1 Tax=Apostasia shenzhenica TaxID=1088818 RepID=A0A2I0AMH2_9ASPA|nr:hypothetical protein AXF42_Ash012864 [Apostasia shenzhenica]
MTVTQRSKNRLYTSRVLWFPFDRLVAASGDTSSRSKEKESERHLVFIYSLRQLIQEETEKNLSSSLISHGREELSKVLSRNSFMGDLFAMGLSNMLILLSFLLPRSWKLDVKVLKP